MFFLDPVISTDSDYTELIRVTHSAELMLSSQQTLSWLERVDFLFWPCRQRDADKVIDYDV